MIWRTTRLSGFSTNRLQTDIDTLSCGNCLRQRKHGYSPLYSFTTIRGLSSRSPTNLECRRRFPVVHSRKALDNAFTTSTVAAPLFHFSTPSRHIALQSFTLQLKLD